jgi:hypothetical protein
MNLDKKKLGTLVKKQSSVKMPMAKLGAMHPATGAPPAAAPAAPAAPAKVNPLASKLKALVGAKPEDDGQEVHIQDLVDEAAKEAQAAQDPEVEDALVGHDSGATADAPPAFASDKDKWAEAAEAVGLGTPKADAFDEPVAVAAYLYKKLGGAMGAATEQPEGSPAPSPAGADDAGAVKPEHVRAAAGKLMAAKQGKSPAAPKPAAAPGAAPTQPGEEKPQHDGNITGHVVSKAAQAVKESPDPELDKVMENYDPTTDGNPPTWAEDADTWAAAEAAVKPTWEQHAQPYHVVAHVYKQMGGTVGKVEKKDKKE